MRWTCAYISLALGLLLTAGGCSRADERGAQQEAAVASRPSASADEISVKGCLTAAPDRNAFVVTADQDALAAGALRAGSGEIPTYTYELIGTNTDLAPHVGRMVEVKGRVDRDHDDEVDVDAKDKTTEAPVRAGGDTVTPTVETKQEIEIKVRRLQVVSATPTGQPCSQK